MDVNDITLNKSDTLASRKTIARVIDLLKF